MIDVVAVLVILGLAAMGARWAENNDLKSERHNMFCLGLCTHTKEEHSQDPNEPAPEGQQQEK